jgi:hypothetical protein
VNCFRDVSFGRTTVASFGGGPACREIADGCAAPSGQEGVWAAQEPEGPRLQLEALPPVKVGERLGVHIRTVSEPPEFAGRREPPESGLGEACLLRVGGQHDSAISAKQFTNVPRKVIGWIRHDDQRAAAEVSNRPAEANLWITGCRQARVWTTTRAQTVRLPSRHTVDPTPRQRQIACWPVPQAASAYLARQIAPR